MEPVSARYASYSSFPPPTANESRVLPQLQAPQGNSADQRSGVTGQAFEGQYGIQPQPSSAQDFMPYGPDGRMMPIAGATSSSTPPALSPAEPPGSDSDRTADRSGAPEQGESAEGGKNGGQPGTAVTSKPIPADAEIKNPQIQAEVSRLKATEEKVKAHEAAHKSSGGTMTGPVSYSYTRGPDGKNYITGGEVPIRVTSGKTPEETASRMQQVIQAALAPADPSPQDRAVAAQASTMQQQARMEMVTSNPASGGQEKPAVSDPTPDSSEGNSRDRDPLRSTAAASAAPGQATLRPSRSAGPEQPASAGGSFIGSVSRAAYTDAAVSGSAENTRQREVTTAAADAAVPQTFFDSARRTPVQIPVQAASPGQITGFGSARPVSLYA